MANYLSGAEFSQAAEDSVRQVNVSMTAGSIALECKDAKAANAVWVEIPDSSFAVSTNFTFYAKQQFTYRAILTGDAIAWVSI